MAEAPIRTALFVDFDQVYGGLYRIRPEAAERFATQPDKWLRFFEEGQHVKGLDEGDEATQRVILVRKCYLNPVGSVRNAAPSPYRSGPPSRDLQDNFSKYRAYFTRAAFSVVDCPPLTSRGKNSADIVMAMDIIDALGHKTHFEEFIILSGDADFTPVLLRLREHDRATTILGDTLVAAAYRAACDNQVRQQDFIEQAMGLSAAAPIARDADDRSDGSRPTLIDHVTQAVAAYLRQGGPRPINHLIPVFNGFPEFVYPSDGLKWFGYGSLTRLVDEMASREDALQVDKSDPSFWVLSCLPSEDMPDAPDDDDATAAIVACVKDILSSEPEPIPLARLGQIVRHRLQLGQDADWPGGARFGDLLRDANDPHIVVIPDPPGFAHDPIAYPGREGRPQGAIEPGDEMRALVAKITQVSGCPALRPAEFRLLFEQMAAELQTLNGAARVPWTQWYLASAVYERCAEQGARITRDAVSYVLTSLENAGYNWHAGPDYHTADTLTDTFLDNLEALCEGARLELSDDELGLLEEWVSDTLIEHDTSEAPPEEPAAP
ncbi:MAG: NYN domain-containing protein [Rhodospirillales bacterium]